jgi:omega-6 fatty acid desaturase (delta-12 desaturase)
MPDRRVLMQALARYRPPNRVRSILEIAITIVPLALLWLLMWRSLEIGYGICLLLAIPAAAFLVRLFMIQHDCGHGAFFRQRLSNDWVGRAIGVVTLTPYDFWRHTHALHHAGSGNLGRRGWGDVDTLTVRSISSSTPIGVTIRTGICMTRRFMAVRITIFRVSCAG